MMRVFAHDQFWYRGHAHAAGDRPLARRRIMSVRSLRPAGIALVVGCSLAAFPPPSRAQATLSVEQLREITVPSPNRPQSIKDGVQLQKPQLEDYVAMLDGIPLTAPAKPKAPRKVLIFCHAAGFVHSSIPLAAETVKAMGEKTGAYSSTITYDPADITAANLAGYD